MQRTEIGGVPVLWEQGPAPLAAALVFGVGARHESFRTAGVTHLVEHLVMSTLPKSALDRNAQVDLDITVFHAAGPEADVVDFLNRVCRGVSQLPLDRIERELGVLRAEDGVAEHPAVGLSLRARYGFQAQGLAGTTGAGPSSLTRDHVIDHARRHFTRENASLVFSGEPPAGLEMDLPSGSPVPLPSAPHVDLRLPGLIAADHFPVVALSGVVDGSENDSAAASVTASILKERLEDELRGRHGISYDVGFGGASIRLGQSMPVVWADGHDDKWQVVVDTLWTALKTLADDGPTAEELDHALAVARAELEDPRAIAGWLVFQAARTLNGREPRTRQEQAELERTLDAATIQACAQQMLDTALLLAPDARVHLDDVPDITEDHPPTSDPIDGHLYRRKVLAIAPRDLAVRVSDQGISVTARGVTGRVDWSDTVAVASAPGVRGIIASDGRQLSLIAKCLRDGDEMLAQIDGYTAGLAFDADPDEILA